MGINNQQSYMVTATSICPNMTTFTKIPSYACIKSVHYTYKLLYNYLQGQVHEINKHTGKEIVQDRFIQSSTNHVADSVGPYADIE